MSILHACTAPVVLSEDETAHLEQVPDGAHELVDILRCELQAAHSGPHLALGQAGGDGRDWWLRWSATERCLVAVDEETGYCEEARPETDPQPDDDYRQLCQLPSGHFGIHSWQMAGTAIGRAPSAANQQKLIDAVHERFSSG